MRLYRGLDLAAAHAISTSSMCRRPAVSNNHNIVAIVLCMASPPCGRFSPDFPVPISNTGTSSLSANHLQLLDGRRPVDITRPPAAAAVPAFSTWSASLPEVGGFTGTLQAAHHDDGRGLGGDIDTGLFTPPISAVSSSLTILMTMLSRGQALQHLASRRRVRVTLAVKSFATL